MNPCEQCIVNSMCQDPCDCLIEYIRNNVTGYQVAGYGGIAEKYRRGYIKLLKRSDGGVSVISIYRWNMEKAK